MHVACDEKQNYWFLVATVQALLIYVIDEM